MIINAVMDLPPFILASTSPRRAELLRSLVLDFKIVPSAAEELWHEHLSPLELCQLNAHRKARAVAEKIPDAWVLGADTLVFLDGEPLGKPGDLAEAQALLARHGALDETIDRARAYGDQALAALAGFPDGPIRRSMADIVAFCIARAR